MNPVAPGVAVGAGVVEGRVREASAAAVAQALLSRSLGASSR
jgi:hypothetical protein